MAKDFSWYLAAAGRLLRREGAREADPAEVASWAQGIDGEGPLLYGVIVDTAGRILATTSRQDSLYFSHYYVDEARIPIDRRVTDKLVSNVIYDFKRAAGADVLHITAGNVLRGTAITREDCELALAAHRVRQAATQSASAQEGLRAAVIAAHEAGVSDTELSRAAGVNRSTIWRWHSGRD